MPVRLFRARLDHLEAALRARAQAVVEAVTGDLRADLAALPANNVIVLEHQADLDRKSTRLNSSHSQISYAVFCLKKKKHEITRIEYQLVLRLTNARDRFHPILDRCNHTRLSTNCSSCRRCPPSTPASPVSDAHHT